MNESKEHFYKEDYTFELNNEEKITAGYLDQLKEASNISIGDPLMIVDETTEGKIKASSMIDKYYSKHFETMFQNSTATYNTFDEIYGKKYGLKFPKAEGKNDTIAPETHGITIPGSPSSLDISDLTGDPARSEGIFKKIKKKAEKEKSNDALEETVDKANKDLEAKGKHMDEEYHYTSDYLGKQKNTGSKYNTYIPNHYDSEYPENDQTSDMVDKERDRFMRDIERLKNGRCF